ncbi:MAG TPA: porin family protein [Hyphomicrobiales bacterium]|nr:porin family protein [Hyphomicrobiales bacterium]
MSTPEVLHTTAPTVPHRCLSHAIRYAWLAGTALACLLCAPLPALAASSQDELRPLDNLVEERRFPDAYALAQTLLNDWEGEPEFDFLYGTAALESGHANEAVFAFERLVRGYPAEPRFKLELARALFEQNNLGAARELFESVLATGPSINVQNNIHAFLDAIADRERAVQPRLDWYLSTAVGNDSNINSATELGVISTPIGDVELNPNGQSLEDSFVELGGGMAYVKPLSKTTAFNANASYSRRDNIDTHAFDLDVLAGTASYTQQVRDLRLSYGVRAQHVALAGDPFQNSASLILGAQRSAGNGWNQYATVAYTGVRYATGQVANANLRDVDQWLGSAALTRTTGRFNHGISAYYGNESARHALGRNNAQRFYGAALSEQVALHPQHLGYARISLHRSENRAPAPIFNRVREDTIFSASLGWLWRINGPLTLSTDLTYTDNDSNLALFSYDRLKFQSGLRYQF